MLYVVYRTATVRGVNITFAACIFGLDRPPPLRPCRLARFAISYFRKLCATSTRILNGVGSFIADALPLTSVKLQGNDCTPSKLMEPNRNLDKIRDKFHHNAIKNKRYFFVNLSECVFFVNLSECVRRYIIAKNDKKTESILWGIRNNLLITISSTTC